MTAPRFLFRKGENNSIVAAYDGSIAVDKGDLMFLDSDDAKPASSQSDAGTEAKNQRTFAQLFLGVAGESRLSTDSSGDIKVHPTVDAEYDCASATFEVGDLVAVDEAASGTALEDQKLVKTTDPDVALGYAIKRYASATTRVQVRLVSRLMDDTFKGGAENLFGGTVNTETLSGAKTLVAGDARIQALDPDGSNRDVNLPAEASSRGLMFWIKNTAGGAEILTIKDDGGSTICTPTENETAIVYCDGTSWYGIVASHA